MRYRNARLCRECHTPVTRVVFEQAPEPMLRDVRRLRLGPDDIVLVTLAAEVSGRDANALIPYLERIFPNNKIVVLQNARLEIIAREEPCPSPT
jgi:hypothetical protein